MYAIWLDLASKSDFIGLIHKIQSPINNIICPFPCFYFLFESCYIFTFFYIVTLSVPKDAASESNRVYSKGVSFYLRQFNQVLNPQIVFNLLSAKRGMMDSANSES